MPENSKPRKNNTSYYERKFVQALRDQGLTVVTGRRFYYGSGKYIVPDITIEDRKLVIEVDGQHHLTDPDQQRRDGLRDNTIRKAGYEIMHIQNKAIDTDEERQAVSAGIASRPKVIIEEHHPRPAPKKRTPTRRSNYSRNPRTSRTRTPRKTTRKRTYRKRTPRKTTTTRRTYPTRNLRSEPKSGTITYGQRTQTKPEPQPRKVPLLFRPLQALVNIFIDFIKLLKKLFGGLFQVLGGFFLVGLMIFLFFSALWSLVSGELILAFVQAFGSYLSYRGFKALIKW